MNNKKKILAFLAAICLLSSSTAFAEYDPNKEIDTSVPYTTLSLRPEEAPAEMNGAKVDGVPVQEVGGIIMMPLRSVAESLGYAVTWVSETRSVELTRGAHFITMSIDKDEYAFSRRAPQALGAAPTLVGDSTYVPMSFVSDIIGGYFAANEDGTYKIVQPAIVTVSDISEDGAITVEDSYLGTVVIRIGEETAVTKGMDRRIYGIDDIEVGMTLAVEYSDAMTASLPPQNTPVKIDIVAGAEDVPAADETEEAEDLRFEGVITEIFEDGVIIGNPAKDADAKKLIISEETVITRGQDRRIYKIDDLEVGMTISGTHAEAATMSIPPQMAALTIQIVADQEEAISVSGTITEITEETVLITKDDSGEELALIVSEETVITRGMDKRIYKIDDLEVGMKITAKHSTMMLQSLPPQTPAYEIAIEG